MNKRERNKWPVVLLGLGMILTACSENTDDLAAIQSPTITQSPTVTPMVTKPPTVTESPAVTQPPTDAGQDWLLMVTQPPVVMEEPPAATEPPLSNRDIAGTYKCTSVQLIYDSQYDSEFSHRSVSVDMELTLDEDGNFTLVNRTIDYGGFLREETCEGSYNIVYEIHAEIVFSFVGFDSHDWEYEDNYYYTDNDNSYLKMYIKNSWGEAESFTFIKQQ